MTSFRSAISETLAVRAVMPRQQLADHSYTAPGEEHVILEVDRFYAQPVLSNGVVEITASDPVVTDAPPSKYPAGSSPFALPAPDHPSTNCNALQP